MLSDFLEYSLGAYSLWALIPQLWHQILKKGVFTRGPEGAKKVALTFDDGPDPRYTPYVLDVLSKYNVKSTFFLVAKKAMENPDIVKRIVMERHEIGNHTFRHKHAWFMLPSQMKREIEMADRVLEGLVGHRPKYFRPPWGAFNLFTYWIAKNYHNVILWTYAPWDWTRTITSNKIVERVLRHVKDGMIVLLHDSGGAEGAPLKTIKALPYLIEGLFERGYNLVTLKELFNAESGGREKNEEITSFDFSILGRDICTGL